MYVWIHWNSTETWLQSKCLITVLHHFDINNKMSRKKNQNQVDYSNINNDQIKTWVKSKYSGIVININNKMPNLISNLLQFKINLSLFMCVLFFSSFVYISAYANVKFETTIIKQNTKIIIFQNNIHVSEVYCGSAVRFGLALPGYLITAHHLYACLL